MPHTSRAYADNDAYADDDAETDADAITRARRCVHARAHAHTPRQMQATPTAYGQIQTDYGMRAGEIAFVYAG
jgi:hypothetical protein